MSSQNNNPRKSDHVETNTLRKRKKTIHVWHSMSSHNNIPWKSDQVETNSLRKRKKTIHVGHSMSIVITIILGKVSKWKQTR